MRGTEPSSEPVEPLVSAAPGAGESIARSVLRPVPRPVQRFAHGLPDIRAGRYFVRFARNEADLHEVQRLRFEVFNRELGEGLAESWDTGRDEDRYDQVCDHLMLVDTRTRTLVGTYRMQTAEMARAGNGFYCDEEFDLSDLPDHIVARAAELGRACISKKHRNGLALYVLWRGLAAFVTAARKSLVFGCCSLTSQDPDEGESMYRRLQREGRISTECRILPREGFTCRSNAERLPRVKMPRLFRTYLRYNALACGPPAIDRAFRTIDFFIVLDTLTLDPKLRAMFFDGAPTGPDGHREGAAG